MRGLQGAATSLLLLMAAKADSPLRWLMIGDWGISGYNQNNVAKAMGTYASVYTPSFVLSLGDNFYNNGVQSTSDSLWASRCVLPARGSFL